MPELSKAGPPEKLRGKKHRKAKGLDQGGLFFKNLEFLQDFLENPKNFF